MDDYIKRKSVYDALCKICNERGACDYTGQESCHKVFSQIPAADVRENVQGKWVYNEIHNNFFCSLCHCDRYGRSNEDGSVSFNNFCPNCGADMRNNT